MNLVNQENIGINESQAVSDVDPLLVITNIRIYIIILLRSTRQSGYVQVYVSNRLGLG